MSNLNDLPLRLLDTIPLTPDVLKTVAEFNAVFMDQPQRRHTHVGQILGMALMLSFIEHETALLRFLHHQTLEDVSVLHIRHKNLKLSPVEKKQRSRSIHSNGATLNEIFDKLCSLRELRLLLPLSVGQQVAIDNIIMSCPLQTLCINSDLLDEEHGNLIAEHSSLRNLVLYTPRVTITSSSETLLLIHKFLNYPKVRFPRTAMEASVSRRKTLHRTPGAYWHFTNWIFHPMLYASVKAFHMAFKMMGKVIMTRAKGEVCPADTILSVTLYVDSLEDEAAFQSVLRPVWRACLNVERVVLIVRSGVPNFDWLGVRSRFPFPKELDVRLLGRDEGIPSVRDACCSDFEQSLYWKCLDTENVPVCKL